MEYIAAEKITDDSAVEGHDMTREDLAATIADVYLHMGLTDGVFHADPHPGNLAVDDDGRLVIYDFGMCQTLDPAVQSQIVDLYMSLSRQDVDGLIEALIRLDILDRAVDRHKVRQVLELSIESLTGQSQLTWRDIFVEITVSLRDFPFRIPPNVMLLIRVGTVGEGVCRSLDPEFDFLAAVRSHLIEEGYVERELRSQLTELREELVRSAPAVTRLPRRLDTVLERLDRGEIVVRTARVDRSRDSATPFAILSAGLFVTGGVVYPHARIVATVATVGAAVCLVLMLRRRQ
jgi:predicted unusual protein kinase regulating ubiquinone biosynthesis (AarF/ABC1/UbiB family)